MTRLVLTPPESRRVSTASSTNDSSSLVLLSGVSAPRVSRRLMMENPYTCGTELDELSPDDSIIDYSSFCDDNFVLIILLTSNGEAQSYFENGREKPRKCVVNVRAACSTGADPVRVCIGSQAAFVLFGLSDGNLLVMPIKTLIDVTWGGSSWSSTSVIDLALPSVDPCLAFPTSIQCFVSNFPPRTLAVVSNKAGNILIVDLLLRRCTAELRAPQSVHRMEMFTDENSIELLVTGFTGAQWIIPLERNGRGMSEILTTCVPADLQQLEPVTCQLFSFDKNVLALDSDSWTVEIYSTINSVAHSTKKRYKVPDNTWMVHFTDNVIFAIGNDGQLRSSVHMGVANARLEYSLVKNSAEWRPLGMVTMPRRSGRLPGVFLVNERGLVRIQHNSISSLKSVAAEFLFRLAPFSSKYIVEVADACRIDAADLQRSLISTILDSRRRRRLSRQDISRLVTISKAINTSMTQLVEIFEQNGLEEQLLPEVLSTIEKEGRAKSAKMLPKVVDLFVKKASGSSFEERRVADVHLSNFLAKYEEVSNGADSCIRVGLWRSGTTLAARQQDRGSIAAVLLRYVIKEGHRLWKDADFADRLQILTTICQLDWTPLEEGEAARLCALLSAWQRDISSPAYHESCLRIAKQYSEKFPRPCSILYLVSAMYILAECRQLESKSLPTSNPLSAGLNCGAAISLDDRVMLWGDFSNLQQKTVDPSHLSPKIRRIKPSTSSESTSSNASTPTSSSVNLLPESALPRELKCSGGRPRAVSCGAEHVLVLTMSGQLYAWGGNRFGQCGVGHCFRLSDLQLIDSNKKWGKVVSMSAGQFHSAFICDSGSLWMWGWGLYGQLGMGGRSTCDSSAPVRIDFFDSKVVSVACGRVHTVALTEDGEVFVCGGGSYGQMGVDTDIRKTYSFQKLCIDGDSKVTQIATNYYHSLCVTEDGKIFEWGRNPQELKMRMFVMRRLKNAQQKALNDENEKEDAFSSPSRQPLDLPMTVPRNDLGLREIKHFLDGKITQLSAGLSHSALLTDKGSVYTWGKALEHQLGHGSKMERREPHQLFEPKNTRWSLVRCGNNHTFAATADGQLYSWGRNDFAQCAVVTEKPAGFSPRRILLQAKDGANRRTIPLPDDTSFVTSPTLVPNILIRGTQSGDLRTSILDEDELLRKIRACDVHTAQAVSRHLYALSNGESLKGFEASQMSENEVYDESKNGPLCTATAFVHLMAGDVLRAIRVISWLKKDENADKESLRALSSLVWEVVANHEDVQTRRVLAAAFREVPMAESMRRGRQIAQLWPLVWDDEDAQATLNVDEKIAMLDAFTAPAKPVNCVSLPSSALNVSSKIRVFSQCAHAEPAMVGTPSECSACLDEWTEKVRATFST
ncbi:unnamed protein product [Caenorhabditis auriculariae]|uniref:RCC1-like domain-containing protein n=1 Tax=Caenorhabditis auriculariae TaxID=2777116 RepID=A0A8S1HV78_9PELO|nr:unnamed protein product [Caenorhabditis auriculariae]